MTSLFENHFQYHLGIHRTSRQEWSKRTVASTNAFKFSGLHACSRNHRSIFWKRERIIDWVRTCQSRHAGETCCSRYAVLPGYNTPTTVPHVPRPGLTVIGWDEVFISFGSGRAPKIVIGRCYCHATSCVVFSRTGV